MAEKKSEQMTFRPPPNVRELLDEAQRITGSDRSALILACIEDAIDRVKEREIERQMKEVKARQEALRRSKGAKS